MQYNTALGFVLAGAGLIALSSRQRTPAMVAGGLAAAIGFITLLQYIFDVNLGLDQLFNEQFLFADEVNPGRMAPNTAFCFTLSGMALFVHGHRISGRPQFLVLSALGLLLFGMSMASFMSYLGDAQMTFGWGSLTEMAIHTSMGFMILSLSVLSAAWMGDLSDADPGQYWQPVTLGAVGVMITLFLWQSLMETERQKIQFETTIQAQRVTQAVKISILNHVTALERMGRRWEEEGGTPEGRWRSDAIGHVSGNQNFEAIIHVDNNFRLKWAEPVVDYREYQDTNLTGNSGNNAPYADARDRDGVTISNSIELVTGGQGFLVYVPLFIDREFDGFVFGTLSYLELVEDAIFVEVERDDALQLIDGTDVVYASHKDEVSLPDWQMRNTISLFDREWTLIVQPTGRHIAEAQSWLPSIVLVAGLLLSLLMGGVLYLMFVANQRTRQHEEELDARKRIEAALSENRDQLKETLQSQQILVSAVQSTISPMVLSDMGGKITLVNKAFLDLLGYEKVDELIGRYTSEIWRDVDVYESATEELKEHRRARLDAVLSCKDGTAKSVEIQASIADGAKGKGMQIITSCIDMTERNLSQEALKTSNNDLSRSNKELDDFAYIASHDLKEPLRGLTNYSGYLLEEYMETLDEKGQGYLLRMIHLTKRMDALIDSLLQFSRLGRVDMARGDCDLNEITDDILDTLKESLEEQGVEVRKPRRLPHYECDEVRVGELFRNLITNAAKYSNKDEKWMEIGYEDSSGKPVFYVRDNGIGIPEKHQKKVFDVFKRLHGRDKFGGGTGAGLAIAEKIAALHGGRIWLQSEKGVGTTFFFTLSPDEQAE